jgi:hypothetical protein
VLSFLLVLPLNGLTIAMSVPAVFLAGSYPYTKRFLAIPQAYLGIAFGFGIPMAFAAFQNDIPLVAWVMLLANVFWAVAYDTEYAMVDRPDDLKIGIKTSAITFGRFEVAAIMICYAMTLLLLGWAGLATGAGAPFLAGLAVAAGLMAYHYTLIRERDRPVLQGVLAQQLGGRGDLRRLGGGLPAALRVGGFSARRAGVAGRCAAAGDQVHGATCGAPVGMGKQAAGGAHGLAADRVGDDLEGHLQRVGDVVGAHRGTHLDGLLADRLEVEGVGADDHRAAHRAGLDRVLAAEPGPRAADDRHVGGAVVGVHLAHRIAQPDPGVGHHRHALRALLHLEAGALDQLGDLVEAVGVAGHQHQQHLGRAHPREGFEQRAFPSRVLAASRISRWGPKRLRKSAASACMAGGGAMSNLMLPVIIT